MIDITGEFAAALDAVYASPAVATWLDARGLTAHLLELVGGGGVCRATLTASTGTWEPDPDGGERVLVVPVWDGPACHPELASYHPADIIDLVAWRPSDPATLYLRLGIVTVLGVDGLRQARDTASPLRLHRTVEGFVRGGGEVSGEYPAAVLLVPSLAWLHLRDLPAVIADDIDHGTELERLLLSGRPPLPPIRVPAPAARMAA